MTPKVAAALALIASRRIARAAKRIQRRPATAPVKVVPPTPKALVEQPSVVEPPVPAASAAPTAEVYVPSEIPPVSVEDPVISSADAVPESPMPRHKKNKNRKKERRSVEVEDDSTIL